MKFWIFVFGTKSSRGTPLYSYPQLSCIIVVCLSILTRFSTGRRKKRFFGFFLFFNNKKREKRPCVHTRLFIVLVFLIISRIFFVKKWTSR